MWAALNAAHPDPGALSPDSYARRFTGVQRLYGTQSQQRLAQATVMVVGIGGVGSWAAEALARSGVGRLVLVDLDHVAESNLNRQVHAVDATVGAAKVDVMAQRIRSFAPLCEVVCIDDFLDPDNARSLLTATPGLPDGCRLDAVVDAVDQMAAKLAMVTVCRRAKLPLIVCGGAGGKTDPTMIRRADLADTTQDPLLAKLRNRLRREAGYPKQGRMRVDTVYSLEPMRRQLPDAVCAVDALQVLMPSEATADLPKPIDGGAGLACAGYGSVVTVTAVLGMAAASAVINRIAAWPKR